MEGGRKKIRESGGLTKKYGDLEGEEENNVIWRVEKKYVILRV